MKLRRIFLITICIFASFAFSACCDNGLSSDLSDVYTDNSTSETGRENEMITGYTSDRWPPSFSIITYSTLKKLMDESSDSHPADLGICEIDENPTQRVDEVFDDFYGKKYELTSEHNLFPKVYIPVDKAIGCISECDGLRVTEIYFDEDYYRIRFSNDNNETVMFIGVTTSCDGDNEKYQDYLELLGEAEEENQTSSDIIVNRVNTKIGLPLVFKTITVSEQNSCYRRIYAYYDRCVIEIRIDAEEAPAVMSAFLQQSNADNFAVSLVRLINEEKTVYAD